MNAAPLRNDNAIDHCRNGLGTGGGPCKYRDAGGAGWSALVSGELRPMPSGSTHSRSCPGVEPEDPERCCSPVGGTIPPRSSRRPRISIPEQQCPPEAIAARIEGDPSPFSRQLGGRIRRARHGRGRAWRRDTLSGVNLQRKRNTNQRHRRIAELVVVPAFFMHAQPDIVSLLRPRAGVALGRANSGVGHWDGSQRGIGYQLNDHYAEVRRSTSSNRCCGSSRRNIRGSRNNTGEVSSPHKRSSGIPFSCSISALQADLQRIAQKRFVKLSR
jgi:hypothetical protein